MSMDTNDDPAEHDCMAIEESLASAREDLERAVRERDEARREAERMRMRFLSVVPVDDPAYLTFPWERGGDDG